MVAHTTTEARTADWAVRQYAGLVWRKARQFARQSGGLLSEEDAAAELFAALVAKWPRYDPARAGPTTFAWWVLVRHGVRMVEVAKKQGFTGGDVGRPVRAAYRDPAGGAADPVDHLPDREHPGEMPAWPWAVWRKVACAGRLTDREGRVVYWRMHGLRLVEIGFRENLAKEAVRLVAERAVAKLRENAAAVAAVTDDLPRRGVVR